MGVEVEVRTRRTCSAPNHEVQMITLAEGQTFVIRRGLVQGQERARRQNPAVEEYSIERIVLRYVLNAPKAGRDVEDSLARIRVGPPGDRHLVAIARLQDH